MSKASPKRTAYQTYQKLSRLINQQVKGRQNDGGDISLSTIDLILSALFTGTHILLEDYPGSGKTLLAKALAESIDFGQSSTSLMKGYQRVQCMVDLLPTDVTGTWIKKGADWTLDFGPIFSHVLLVDEINRTTPKVQSAFLEAMAEKQVTISKEVYHLQPIFFLIATQNPHDKVGTFELPIAQLDRFLFKRILAPLSEKDLRAVISLDQTSTDQKEQPIPLDELLNAMKALTQPLNILEIENDLISLHLEFTKLIRLSKPQQEAQDEQVIAPHCTLSPRTLRLLKRVVDMRVNLEAEATGSSPCYRFEDHLEPLLLDLLRHRIQLIHQQANEYDLEQVITKIARRVCEASIQRQRAR